LEDVVVSVGSARPTPTRRGSSTRSRIGPRASDNEDSGGCGGRPDRSGPARRAHFAVNRFASSTVEPRSGSVPRQSRPAPFEDPANCGRPRQWFGVHLVSWRDTVGAGGEGGARGAREVVQRRRDVAWRCRALSRMAVRQWVADRHPCARERCADAPGARHNRLSPRSREARGSSRVVICRPSSENARMRCPSLAMVVFQEPR
jgi:hypothetical protein